MVGLFPNGYRNRLGALMLAAVAAMALTTQVASAEDDLTNKQRDVQRAIDGAEHDLESSSAQAAAAAEQLAAADAALAQAQARLAETRQQLAAAQAEDARMQAALDEALRNLEQARAELAEGKRQVALQKKKIAALVTSVYEQGDPRLIGFAAITQAGDPGDMTRAIAFNEAYGNREDALLGDLRDAERALAAHQDQVELRKGEVEQSRAAAAANLSNQERLTQETAAQTAEVQNARDERASAQAAAVAVRAADEASLAQLKAEEDRIDEMLRQRALEAVRNGAPGKSDGFLSYPANGRVTSTYGTRIHPITGETSFHNGVDFGGPCGANLYAGADGTVVAKGSGYPSGNYLYIDHGGRAGVGLSTTYSHAVRYVVNVGQRVTRGQVVGYVGSTGRSTGCHLHFTVKENGTNVDPMKWL